MTMRRDAQSRSPIHQVDDILRLNARILAMNERLLQAILRHNNVSEVRMEHIDIDEIMKVRTP